MLYYSVPTYNCPKAQVRSLTCTHLYFTKVIDAQEGFHNDPAPRRWWPQRTQLLRRDVVVRASTPLLQTLTSEEMADAGSPAQRQDPQDRTGESPGGSFLPTGQPPDEENKARSTVEREQSQETELEMGVLRPGRSPASASS